MVAGEQIRHTSPLGLLIIAAPCSWGPITPFLRGGMYLASSLRQKLRGQAHLDSKPGVPLSSMLLVSFLNPSSYSTKIGMTMASVLPG